MTSVANIRKESYDVYIGRAGKGLSGKWGNPFSNGARDENIDLFRKWIVNQPHLVRDLPELKGKVLGCFCKPAACHGDVLAQLADLSPIYPIGTMVEEIEQYGFSKIIGIRLDDDGTLWYRLRSVKSDDGIHKMGWVDQLHVQLPTMRRHDIE